jgi:hypothetical protein
MAMARLPRLAALRPAYAGAQLGADVLSWTLTLLNWLLRLAVIGALLATWLGLTPLDGWRAALGGEWAAALPLQAPAGLGSYEAGVWAALAWRGAALPETVLATLVPAALALHLATLLLALLSWALWQSVCGVRGAGAGMGATPAPSASASLAAASPRLPPVIGPAS